MSRIVLVIFIMVYFLSSAAASDTKEPPAIAVPLVKLLADPHLYEGAPVQVMGYADIGIYLGLFLTKDHADISDFLSSIRIVDTPDGGIISSGCLPGYIKIRGKFIRTKDKNYALVNITRISKPQGGACWVKSDFE